MISKGEDIKAVLAEVRENSNNGEHATCGLLME